MTVAIVNFTTELIRRNPWAPWTLFVFSITMVVAAVLLVPIVVVRIPQDYFAHRRPPAWGWQKSHPALRVTAIATKNAIGALLFALGLVMLITPGQGVLTILLGLALLDIPGKRRLERRIVARPAIFRALNALRKRHGKPPLDPPVVC